MVIYYIIIMLSERKVQEQEITSKFPHNNVQRH